MERLLTHPKLTKRVLRREGCNVILINEEGIIVNELNADSELTAKAFEHFLMLAHKDKGYAISNPS